MSLGEKLPRIIKILDAYFWAIFMKKAYKGESKQGFYLVYFCLFIKILTLSVYAVCTKFSK